MTAVATKPRRAALQAPVGARADSGAEAACSAVTLPPEAALGRLPLKLGVPMSRCQVEVIELGASGLTRAQIGRRLGVSGPTVTRYLARAAALLGAGNPAGLTGAAYRVGLLVRRPLPPSVRVPTVTDRCAAVLPLLARGRSNAQIGHTLGVTASAVNMRVRYLMRVFGAVNRASLVRAVIDAGILSTDLELIGAAP